MSTSSSGQPRVKTDEGARNLSLALMAGAFGFIGIGFFAAGAFFDKIERTPLIIGLVLVAVAVVTLLAGVIFGGWGIAYGAKIGANNAFDLQAKSGVIGFLLLVAAGAVFALNKKPDEKALLERKVETLEQRVQTLEPQVQALNARVITLQTGLDGVKAKVAQTGRGKSSAGARNPRGHHARKP